MTPEVIISGANLLALLAYGLRLESRLLRLEAQVEFLARNQK